MPVVTLQEGVRFPAEPDETILDAAARAGVNIGYACRTGRCSTCKCRLLSGMTRALRPEVGLEREDEANGWILSCVRVAESDATLLADELIPFPLPTKQILPCRIDQLTELAPDIIEVRLRLPPTAAFKFIAGQYVDVIAPGGFRRSYSLAGGCSLHKLNLHVRRVPGGELSDYWFDRAKTGDLLRLSGPLGTFFLREVENRRLAFLATGTGIAPITAMLEALAQPGAPRPAAVTVIWGNRHPSDFYLDVSAGGVDNDPWLTLSRPHEGWTGPSGYVQDVFMQRSQDLSNTVVYACGSDQMIRSAKSLLVAAGLDAHDFHSDAFVCSAI